MDRILSPVTSLQMKEQQKISKRRFTYKKKKKNKNNKIQMIAGLESLTKEAVHKISKLPLYRYPGLDADVLWNMR